MLLLQVCVHLWYLVYLCVCVWTKCIMCNLLTNTNQINCKNTQTKCFVSCSCFQFQAGRQQHSRAIDPSLTAHSRVNYKEQNRNYFLINKYKQGWKKNPSGKNRQVFLEGRTADYGNINHKLQITCRLAVFILVRRLINHLWLTFPASKSICSVAVSLCYGVFLFFLCTCMNIVRAYWRF